MLCGKLLLHIMEFARHDAIHGTRDHERNVLSLRQHHCTCAPVSFGEVSAYSTYFTASNTACRWTRVCRRACCRVRAKMQDLRLIHRHCIFQEIFRSTGHFDAVTDALDKGRSLPYMRFLYHVLRQKSWIACANPSSILRFAAKVHARVSVRRRYYQ